MKSTEENSLMLRLNQPEQQRQAFEELVNLYGPQLYRQIRRMVYDHDDTNDILQNTFIKAWNNLDTFRGDARLSSWLYRIAFNECLKEKKLETAIGLSRDGQPAPPDTEEGEPRIESGRQSFEPPVPLFIEYYTIYPRKTGGWDEFPDPYGYDELLVKKLEGI